VERSTVKTVIFKGLIYRDRFSSFLLRICVCLVFIGFLIISSTQVVAQELSDHPEVEGKGDEKEDAIIRKTENPISENVAVSFVNDLSFGVGPDEDIMYLLKIRMINFTKHGDWWLLHRPLLPVIYKPEMMPEEGDKAGLGDLSYRVYLTHKEKGFFWGIGPTFVFPTATSSRLGAKKWSVGPTFGVAMQRGKWLFGGVFMNIWSVAGDSDRPSVNAFTARPFVSYRMSRGWFVESSPEIIAGWKADRNNRWIVPMGAGFGKVFRINNKPMVIRAAGFYNVERPTNAAKWQLRIGFDFVFKKLLWNPY
jgi:hypothetical protein